MEHIVLSHIATHLDENNILSLRRHGFRLGLSCDTQLITAVHDWADTLNRKDQVDLVFLDFNKAFDKVAHRRLEAKLSHYGVKGKTLNWVSAFLSDRKQQVVVGGSQYASLLTTASSTRKYHRQQTSSISRKTLTPLSNGRTHGR